MVEVLGASVSPPREVFPSEIDVYKVPHLRMKELVVSVERILPQIEESLDSKLCPALEKMLQLVYSIMWELKTHEIIENTVIMHTLRERMSSKQVYNQLVCNCHEDSELLSIIDLVEAIYSSLDQKSRTFYWQKLQEEIYHFLDDFDHHMEEEESIFQPLLNQYFNYEELVQIKDKVLFQHQEWKEKVEAEKSLTNLKRGRVEEQEETEEQVVPEKVFREDSPAGTLPREVVVEILKKLEDPRDLARAAQVCSLWEESSREPALWRWLPLGQWEKGIWKFSPASLPSLPFSSPLPMGEELPTPCSLYDRLTDSLLPSVGSSVRQLSFSDSRAVSMGQIRDILQHLPSLTSVDLSYTCLSSPALASASLSLTNLTKLNLSGCLYVTDDLIAKLVKALGTGTKTLKWLSVSGCSSLTDSSLSLLSPVCGGLTYLDTSGCHRFSGAALREFTKGCKSLGPEAISYCDIIQDGPFPDLASGCDNTDCDDQRACCLNRRF